MTCPITGITWKEYWSFRSCAVFAMNNYPTGRKFSLESEFCYFANGKFPKFELSLLLYFYKYRMTVYMIEIQK